jgi:hypothetical protein
MTWKLDTMIAKRPLPTTAAVLAVLLAGCGSSRGPSIPVSGKLERVPGSPVGEIALTAIGAQRIGIQTARVHAVPGPAPIVRTTIVRGVRHRIVVPAPLPPRHPTVVIPYSAVVYDPNGQSFAFTNVAPLHYVEIRITIDHVAGSSAYLVSGPQPGSLVVTVGAEELYGVQTGVLAQT